MEFYKNHKIVMRHGYASVYLPEHPRAYKDGMVYVHILVAEEKLGRLLKSGECIHHIDECKTNNNPENLMVFASNSDHTAYHKYPKNNILFPKPQRFFCRGTGYR